MSCRIHRMTRVWDHGPLNGYTYYGENPPHIEADGRGYGNGSGRGSGHADGRGDPSELNRGFCSASGYADGDLPGYCGGAGALGGYV